MTTVLLILMAATIGALVMHIFAKRMTASIYTERPAPMATPGDGRQYELLLQSGGQTVCEMHSHTLDGAPASVTHGGQTYVKVRSKGLLNFYEVPHA